VPEHGSDKEQDPDEGLDPLEIYRALSGIKDLDALHDLIASRGLQVLRSPFPYLVVAARRRGIDRWRRTSREDLLAEPDSVGPSQSSLFADPMELVVANDELARTLRALASMDDRDVLVVWLAALEHSDSEIASIWDELEFAPRHPTLSAIRKRRQRARQDLRKLISSTE
jgi:DNA-directed RNA polymerase specialized sigma24 family protein